MCEPIFETETHPGKGVLWFMYTSYVGEEGSPKAYACVQVERGNPKARVELRTYFIEDPS